MNIMGLGGGEPERMFLPNLQKINIKSLQIYYIYLICAGAQSVQKSGSKLRKWNVHCIVFQHLYKSTKSEIHPKGHAKVSYSPSTGFRCSEDRELLWHT